MSSIKINNGVLKYNSTKEKTHAARVSRLIVDPCTDLFRDILRHDVTEIQLPGILQKKYKILTPLLFKDQREQLYPTSGKFSGTYEEFDLSLLYILLRNISGIERDQTKWANSPNLTDRTLSANINRIREIRNEYCGHAPRFSLSDVTFHKLWQDLTVIITELQDTLPGGYTIYTDAARMIKTDSMDPEKEEEYLNIIDQQHQTAKELKESIMELNKIVSTMEEEGRSQELYIQGLKKSVDTVELKRKRDKRKIKSEIAALKIKQQRLGSDVEKRKSNLPDSEGENILKNTSIFLKARKFHKVEIKISAVQTIVEELRDSHIAILTGIKGSGKTTTAYQVMREMSDPSLDLPYIPVIISSPDQWDKVINHEKRFIVFLDDFFGSTDPDTKPYEIWKNHLNIMLVCADAGNVMLLIGIRKNILEEVKEYFPNLIEKKIIDLSSKQTLTSKDKMLMLRTYEENSNFKASDLEGDCFSNYSTKNGIDSVYRLSESEKMKIFLSESYYGFPLTCFNFFSNSKFFQLGPSYFKNPNEPLYEEVENMRRGKCGGMSDKLKYCVLCYVYVHGSIKTNNLSEEHLNYIYEKTKITGVSTLDIKDAIADVNSALLTKEGTQPLYKFTHETVLETVMVSFGQLAPEIVINQCSGRQFYELIRTENYESKPGEIVLKIPKSNFENMAQRLLSIHEDKGLKVSDTLELVWNIWQHPASDDSEFMSVLLQCFFYKKMSSKISARNARTKTIMETFNLQRERMVFNSFLQVVKAMQSKAGIYRGNYNVLLKDQIEFKFK